jgi:pimeloyl-ACP methyl ester carboxylesterase
MDGTGALFSRFATEVASWAEPKIVRYPTNVKLSVDELVDLLELDAPTTVIAESFSGAVGIRLAAKHPSLVERLILVGSFVTPPFGSSLMRPFGSVPFQIIPPRFALKQMLVGNDASEELVDEVESALKQVAPEVLAHRLASISRIDERATLRSLQMPIVVLNARQDRLLSAAVRAEVIANAPRAKQVELDGPHLLLQSRPREAAAMIRPS